MLSMMLGQFRQCGVAAFLIRKRCQFRGTWPVRSCVSTSLFSIEARGGLDEFPGRKRGTDGLDPFVTF